MNLASRLADRIAALGFMIPHETQIRLLQYLALIQKWNQVHNLTAVREPESMLTRHLLDSLAITPYITGGRIVDVGSGAGLPGIPLALVRPEWHVALVESNHKKAIFLQQARIELNLKNVEVVAGRVENFSSPEGFDVVISRAFSDLTDFVKLAGHLCGQGDDGGRLMAMKGIYPHEELAQLKLEPNPHFFVEKVLPIAVPSLEAERHLVVMKRSA